MPHLGLNTFEVYMAWKCVQSFKIGEKTIYEDEKAKYIRTNCNGEAIVEIYGKEFSGKARMSDFTQKFRESNWKKFGEQIE